MAAASTRLWLPDQAYYGPRRLREQHSDFAFTTQKNNKSVQTTKKQCPSWPTGWEVMTTSSCWVRGYNSTPSPTVQSTPVNRTVERDSAVSGY